MGVVALLEDQQSVNAVLLGGDDQPGAGVADAVEGLAGAPVILGHLTGVDDILAPVAGFTRFAQYVGVDVGQQPAVLACLDQTGQLA